MKKIISVICCIILLCMPLTTWAAQENATWQKVAGKQEWTYQDAEGTSLTAKLNGYTLTIDGVGEIPAYTNNSLGNRPWHGATIVELVIGNGVTAIGANAFADFQYIYRITIPVSVLIKDSSAFRGIKEDAFFMVKGMNITNHGDEKVPYTSAESFAKLMGDYPSYRFQVDNMYMVQLLKNYCDNKNVTIAPLDALTKDANSTYPLINYSSSISLAAEDWKPGDLVHVQPKQQGVLAREVFSIMLGVMPEYHYVYSYNMSSYNLLGAPMTAEAKTYVMTIPPAYRFAGRTHALIQIGSGVVNILEDEDNSTDTITFTTDMPASVFALVYKDNF
ncbi:MAG: hypothetical protein E7290_01260 [Lachnospiraceae bacterium]|nr:hypothetical protein [Lachnospiraceae bacterium]